jgi:hypothetical protein
LPYAVYAVALFFRYLYSEDETMGRVMIINGEYDSGKTGRLIDLYQRQEKGRGVKFLNHKS